MARKLPKTISEEEFLIGIKQVSDPKKKLAFMLGFYQCMRVSEVVKLKPQDIDKTRGFIHILDAKGGKDRDIPIMKPLERGLSNLPIGVKERQLQLDIKKIFPDLHFHSLRHSGATFYLNVKRIDIRLLQQLLGHSRLDTTQIYTHVTSKDLKDRFNDVW